MAENSNLRSYNIIQDHVDSENLSHCSDASKLQDLDMGGAQKIYVSDQINSLQHPTAESDAFIVDMQRLSHPADKDVTKNSRITRSVSRKWSKRGSEWKANSSNGNERDTTLVSTSPRAALAGGASRPEKPTVVTIMGATNYPINPQIHHQSTITNSSACATAACASESKCSVKRFNFRRSSSGSWAIDPRRILLFFATLSSVGTLLLIYFTLSMSKLSADDSTINR